jgi:hypothetical protein
VKGSTRTVAAFTLLALLAVSPRAWSLLLTVNPRLAAGATNNAYGVSNNQSTTKSSDAYWSAGVNADLLWNRARDTHRLAYGFNTVRYVTFGGADVTTHTGLWSSNFILSSHTSYGMGANVSVFKASAINTVDPAVANPNVIPLVQAPTTIFTGSVSQSLTYEPTGADKYTELASVSLIRSLGESATVPELMQLNLAGRRDKSYGKNTYALAVTLGDFFRLNEQDVGPQGTFSSGHTITGQVLAGYRRDYSARLSLDALAGMMVFYGTTAGTVAVGPAGTATVAYRSVPWYATLTIAQSPSVNIFVGEALVADSATVRVSMPLNARETFLISGFGTYTYARRVTADKHSIFAPRVYDLFSLGASLAYRLERWPIALSLDYTASSQRGSLVDGVYYPSSARSTIGVAVTGLFGFGEGNHGWLRTR